MTAPVLRTLKSACRSLKRGSFCISTFDFLSAWVSLNFSPSASTMREQIETSKVISLKKMNV